MTIARGHLELLRWEAPEAPELEVALDELAGWSASSSGCCCSRRPSSPGSRPSPRWTSRGFLSEIFMRWSEVAPRAWRSTSTSPDRCTPMPRGSRRPRRAARERRQVHRARRHDRAARTRRERRRRDRGRRGVRRAGRGAAAYLRALGTGRRCPVAGAGWRGPRSCDRRGDRPRPRRHAARWSAAPGDDLPRSTCRWGRARAPPAAASASDAETGAAVGIRRVGRTPLGLGPRGVLVLARRRQERERLRWVQRLRRRLGSRRPSRPAATSAPTG